MEERRRKRKMKQVLLQAGMHILPLKTTVVALS
jgi:hypothetical protein